MAAVVVDSRIYVIGGYSDSPDTFTSVESLYIGEGGGGVTEAPGPADSAGDTWK